MIRRPMGKLAAAVAAAGTICALGAGAALAAPATGWSGPSGPVPGAFTNDSPALSTVAFPGKIGQGTLLGWRGRGAAGHVFYKFRTPFTGKWSKTAEVPGALTSSAPSFRGYRDALGRSAVLAVWTGHADHHIWYSNGETRANGTISWTKAADLPKTVLYTNTSNAPALFFPNNRYIAVIAWRGPANHVRYVVGSPKGRGFTWSGSTAVPGSPIQSASHCTVAPCTRATPAVAEVQTGPAAGTLYIFWTQLGSRNVFYSTTADNHATVWTHLTWTTPVQVPGAAALTSPAASAQAQFGVNSPLLLAYKAPAGTRVFFQTLTAGTWSAAAVVPATRTLAAPALLGDLLANSTPTPVGNVILHHYIP
jgi:hypothetical protein